MGKKPLNIKILENVNIVYTDGKKDFFKVISFSDDGIIIGRFINNKFVNCGFIPKNNIKLMKVNNIRKIKL
jgi:hypothetical protein